MESVIEQFPKRKSNIAQLYQENVDFQELCQDYEEVNTLLATWTTSTEVDSTTIDEFRTLLKKLEAEIDEALQTRFQPDDPLK